MDGAEVYLLLLRPSMVPIVGDSWSAPPFYGQIELEGWNWSLVNDQEENLRSQREAAYSSRGGALDTLQKKLYKEFDGKGKKLDDSARKAWLTQELDNARKQQEREAKKAEEEKKRTEREEGTADRDNPLEFGFSKRVDLASTQMLNSMKAGDVFPQCVLTLVHRAGPLPLTLVIKFAKVRLKEYELKVDASDTMSDMKEEWKAEFEEVDYVYNSRWSAQQGKMVVGSNVSATISRNVIAGGQPRIFKMKLKKLLGL